MGRLLMAPTQPPRPPHVKPGGEDPEILVRLVTWDVETLKHFLETNPVEVVRVLPPDDGHPVQATLLLRESVAADAARLAGFEVVVLARPPVTDAQTPQVGRGNRFADPAILPRGRGRIVR